MAEFRGLMLWTDAYLADTGHLGDCEHGRYLMLLMQMWRAPNRRFPNDDVWLARKFRRSVEAVRSELRPILTEFFKTDGNWLFHKRLDEEWKRSCATSAKQSAAAKSRWNKEKEACHGNPSGLERKDKKDKEKDTLSGVSKEKAPAAPAPSLALVPATVERLPQGSRLPTDWSLTDAHLEITRKEGFDDEEARRIAASFADYWHAKPGADARKCDWLATWRGWVRREADKRPKPGFAGAFNGGAGGYGAPRQVDRLTQAAQVVANRRNRANGYFG